MLSNLLLDPLFLNGGVLVHSCSVVYKGVSFLKIYYLLKSSPSNCLQPEIYSGTYLDARSDLSVTLFILSKII